MDEVEAQPPTHGSRRAASFASARHVAQRNLADLRLGAVTARRGPAGSRTDAGAYSARGSRPWSRWHPFKSDHWVATGIVVLLSG